MMLPGLDHLRGVELRIGYTPNVRDWGRTMAEIGNGYGSECHLLRYLGRHRRELDKQVLNTIGGQAVEWLDFPFDGSRTWRDGERKGLDFLEPDSPAWAAWRKAWPQRGNPPNWDAVGILTVNGAREWLLVEAKANLQEIKSSCQASDAGGRPLIVRTLTETKERLGVAADCDWLDGYYQSANRIAVLGLLTEAGVGARLLNIYFTGDLGDAGRTCPSDANGWHAALGALKEHIGLPRGHALENRMHELFLAVCPAS